MLVLVRIAQGKNTVLGELYYNGMLLCNTLENLKKKIPTGIYNLEINESPKFTKKRGESTILPLLYNQEIPASRGIRIHAGNTYKDTSGCILVGIALPLDKNGVDHKLAPNSRQYESDLVSMARMLNCYKLIVIEK